MLHKVLAVPNKPIPPVYNLHNTVYLLYDFNLRKR